MAETQRYEFGAQELVTAMIKQKKIHEGIWGLEIKFNWNAMSFNYGNGVVQPTSLCGIQSYTLARAEQITPLSVDAAVVNPGTRIIDPFARG